MNVKKDFNNVIHKLDELMTSSTGNQSAQLNSGSLDKINQTIKELIEQLYNKLSLKMDENLDRSMMNLQNTSFQGGSTQENMNMGMGNANRNFNMNQGQMGVGSDQARMNEIARDSIVPHIAIDFENKTDG
jgi:hypothetical protein